MKIIYYLFFLLLSVSLHGQILSPVQLQEDFDTLQRALEEAHTGLYRFQSKSTVDKHFIKSRKHLNRPMSWYEFYGVLATVIEKLGDGQLRIDLNTPNRPAPLIFPFRILADKKNTFILSNDTKDDNFVVPGMELVGINGRTMSEIKDIMLACINSDGYNKTGKLARYEKSFSEYYWSYVDTSSAFVMKLKGDNGELVSTVVNGVQQAARETNRQQNPVNEPILAATRRLEEIPQAVSLQMTNDTIARLRVRLFDGNNFRQEMDAVFTQVFQRQPKALILDLRGNRGGLNELAAYLVAKFVNKPFRYLDSVQTRVLIPSFAPWKSHPQVDLTNGAVARNTGGYLLNDRLNNCLLEQQPAQQIYTGKLIVLIDGNTYSAAADCSAILQNLTDAVFVGEETGGGYQGNTSGLNALLLLPHTGFHVNIHLWNNWTAVPTPVKKGRGVIPDHVVERRSADWLKGIDTQLEFAIRLCVTTAGK